MVSHQRQLYPGILLRRSSHPRIPNSTLFLMTSTDFPVLSTERLQLQIPGPELAEAMLLYVDRNREHLARWEPERPPGFYRRDYWAKTLDENRANFVQGKNARFVLTKSTGPPGPIIGSANLNEIVRGCFQACYLGYSLDHEHQGQGFMTEALERLIGFAFEDLELHRLMANYQPDNSQSERLLERLGFEREGYARGYLKLAGEWRDHILTARVREVPGKNGCPADGLAPEPHSDS